VSEPPPQATGFIQRFTSHWDRDRCLSALLILLVTLVFVAVPLWAILGGAILRLLATILLTLVLVVGSGATRRDPASLILAIIIGFGGPGVAQILPGKQPRLEAADALLLSTFFFTLAVLVLKAVFRQGPITTHRIQGAIAAFLLLGVAWAMAYRLVGELDPNAFNVSPDHGRGLEFAYFSFVTISTVGYGDIVPVHPAARAMANLEALTGLLYPAVLIGRLISMQLTSQSDR
jgi:Ion channel